jgi:26S proteasome regulatory subunit T5
MSDSQPPAGNNPPNNGANDDKDGASAGGSSATSTSNQPKTDAGDKDKDVAMEPVEDELPAEIRNASIDDLKTRTRMLENDIRVSELGLVAFVISLALGRLRAA